MPSSAKRQRSNRKNDIEIILRVRLPLWYGKLWNKDEHTPVAITTTCHCHEKLLSNINAILVGI